MAQSQWYDIDMPSAFGEGEQSAPADNTAVAAEEQKAAEEVRLLEAGEWSCGPRGFRFNETCWLTVKAEYLTPTIRRRVEGDLFVCCDGHDEDLRKVVSGTLDAQGAARLQVPLYYGEAYYEAVVTRPDAECSYTVRNIRHSRGANTLDSDELVMPRACAAAVVVPSTVFAQASALPCLDADGVLVSALVTARLQAGDNADSRV